MLVRPPHEKMWALEAKMKALLAVEWTNANLLVMVTALGDAIREHCRLVVKQRKCN